MKSIVYLETLIAEGKTPLKWKRSLQYAIKEGKTTERKKEINYFYPCKKISFTKNK